MRIAFGPKRGCKGRAEELNNEEFNYYSFHKIFVRGNKSKKDWMGGI
jgi:hypothetical protein